jgi:murein DD-endopeptidase MepM/ murein hydrolase activator NlpD
VDAGEVIGYLGTSGTTTGPVLHFEVRDGNGELIDPMSLYITDDN